MPSLKIYPPTRLPSSGITETQFNMWQEELEVYLCQEPDFRIFLPSKLYENWNSYEENPLGIPEPLLLGMVEQLLNKKQNKLMTQNSRAYETI